MRIGFMMPFDSERMEFARKNGFRSVELQAGPDHDYFPTKPDWQAKAKDVRAAFDDAGLRISCIAGFYVNHLDPKEAQSAKELTRNCIDLAKEMGIPVAAGFAGRVVGEDLEASLPEFAKVWKEHARYAEDAGVRIAFENCPMGPYHQPPGGINCMCTPNMWERGFDAVGSEALGLEWDPSHLICMFIDPVANLRTFGSRAYHVHAKDAKVHYDLLAQYGPWHPGVIEHCFPGLGDTDWAACIKELLRAGFESDLNIEGWHDAVYRRDREDEGLVTALRHLEQFVVQD
jgi:sugar phosphate isomerase/epimerase